MTMSIKTIGCALFCLYRGGCALRLCLAGKMQMKLEVDCGG